MGAKSAIEWTDASWRGSKDNSRIYLFEQLSDSIMATDKELFNADILSWPLLKSYIEGETGIEVRLNIPLGDNSSQYLALIHKAAEKLDIKTLFIRHASKGYLRDYKRNLPVLIMVPQLIENMEGMPFSLMVVHNVVRLYSIENVNNVGGQGINTRLLQKRTPVSGHKDREGSAPIEPARSQVVDSIIQRGSHIMNGIPSNQAENGWDGFAYGRPKQIDTLLRIGFSAYGNGLALTPFIIPGAEVLNVLPRTLEPETKSFGWITDRHGVRLLYDKGQEGNYTKDLLGEIIQEYPR